MTGSLQKKILADGKEYYYMVLNFYDKHTGKRKPKWIATGLQAKGNKRRAEELLHKTIAQYPDNSYDANANVLFSDWVQMWLDSTKTYIESSTWEGYTLSAKHIISYFGQKRLTLSQLKPRHFREYYDYMLTFGKLNKKTGERTGLAVRTVRSQKFIINAALNEAVEEEIISRNPAVAIKVSHAKKKTLARKIVFFTLDEAREFIRFVYDRDDVLSDLIYATLYFGLRRSEVLGLTENSVDFKRHILKINQTVVKVTTEHRSSKTKTPDSNREYYLTPEVEQFFKRVIEKKRENQEFFGSEYTYNEALFVWEDGRLIRPDYVYHHFKKLAERFGRPDMTFHALRHSTASMLLELNWHPKEIQDWLGHADFYTTMNIYTHIQKSHNKRNSERLTGVLIPGQIIDSGVLEQVLERPKEIPFYGNEIAV